MCATLAAAIGAASRQATTPAPAGQAVPPQAVTQAPVGPITPAGADDGQALAQLSQLVGTWSVQGSATAADGSTSGPFTGESQFGWTLGGNFLSGDHVLWNAQGEALQTMDVMGFTPGVGFTRSEITNGDRSMFLSTGIYDGAARAITFATSNSLLTPDGKSRSLSTSYFFGFDGSITWETRFQINDESAGSVRLTLTRTSATPGLSTPETAFGAPMVVQGGTDGSGAGRNSSANPSTQSGSFIVQTPQGMAVTRPPQTPAENQQLMSAMMKQRQQMQAQMNSMQGQVPDMSRTMSSGAVQ